MTYRTKLKSYCFISVFLLSIFILWYPITGCGRDADNGYDPCDGIGCNAHGVCIPTEGGEAICHCDPGYKNHWKTLCVIDAFEEDCNGYGWCKPVQLVTDIRLHDIWGSSSDDIWAVGGEYNSENQTWLGSVVHWDGNTWMEFQHTSGKVYNGIWGNSSTEVWMVGYVDVSDSILISKWDGIDIMDEDISTRGILSSIWGTSNDNIWAVGDDFLSEGLSNTVVHYNGKSWDVIDVNTEQPLQAVWGTAADDVWSVGLYDTILHWNGEEWSDLFIQENYIFLFDVNGVSPTDIWGVGRHHHDIIGEVGVLIHWDGFDWRRDLSASGKLEGKSIWGVWATSYNDVWVVGDNGLVLNWNGVNWTEVDVDTQNDLHGVYGIGNDIWIVGENGTIIHHQR